MSLQFFDRMKDEIRAALTKACIHDMDLLTSLSRKARREFTLTVDHDSSTRFEQIANALKSDLIVVLSKNQDAAKASDVIANVSTLCIMLSERLRVAFMETRDSYFANGSAETLLGGSKHLYKFIRKDLGVAMLQGTGNDAECLGQSLTRIFECFESGDIIDPILASIENSDEKEVN